MERHPSKKSRKFGKSKLWNYGKLNGIAPMWTQIAKNCQNHPSPYKYAVHKVAINPSNQNEDNRLKGKALIYGQDKI